MLLSLSKTPNVFNTVTDPETLERKERELNETCVIQHIRGPFFNTCFYFRFCFGFLAMPPLGFKARVGSTVFVLWR